MDVLVYPLYYSTQSKAWSNLRPDIPQNHMLERSSRVEVQHDEEEKERV
jgi:hypothetical protein